MIAQFSNISSPESLFEREMERFANRLAIDPTTNPDALIRRFPEHRDAIGRLIKAAVTELSEAPLDGFPPPCKLCVAPVPKRLGQFRLVERLGAGGMGEVYRGIRDDDPAIEVAIKVIRPELATAAIRDRFDAERRCLTRLRHRHIVRMVDTKAAPSAPPHLAMELIAGTSLTEHCRRNELGTRERIELLIQLCWAIDHVHTAGLIHRDIKPANVLVREVAGQTDVKLIDFGLAKGASSRTPDDPSYQPAANQVLGTLHYMSPEQAGSKQAGSKQAGSKQAGPAHDVMDHRSDLFSLGVVLFELLTQTTPLDDAWAADDPLSTRIGKVRTQRPTRPSERLRERFAEQGTSDAWMRPEFRWALCPDSRRLLDAICIQALAADPNHRYSSARALAADLRCFLAEERFDAFAPGHRRWGWDRTRWHR